MNITRSTTASRIGSGGFIAVALLLFAVPQVLDANVVQQLTSLLIFLILAVMWNALAGYAGLVSVCQQAFIMNKHGAKIELWDNLKGLWGKKKDKGGEKKT